MIDTQTKVRPIMSQKKVFIRQDLQTGDDILSRKPATWDDSIAALKDLNIPAAFLSGEERKQTEQNRDPFDGWVELGEPTLKMGN